MEDLQLMQEPFVWLHVRPDLPDHFQCCRSIHPASIHEEGSDDRGTTTDASLTVDEDTMSLVKLFLNERYGRQEMYEDVLVGTIVDVDLVLIESCVDGDFASHSSDDTEYIFRLQTLNV